MPAIVTRFFPRQTSKKKRLMKIRLLCIGKGKNNHLLSLESEYLKRLKPYGKVSVEEVVTRVSGGSADQKEKEAEALLSKISKQDFVIVLDEYGDCITSNRLSEVLQLRANDGVGDVCLLIGGTFGHGLEVLKRANFKWSLSPLTFTAEMARYICVEQLYRATMIWKGVPYHKD
jgi:23S rRNA (pseudouridine1915-N3)-methyltransferase